jgi:hypothetical protein
MVLIFVSIFSIWLSATLLISQTAASAVARAQQANTESSASASLTAQALSELETKNLQTGLPNQSDCAIAIPTQTFDGTTFSVECTPAADGTFSTTTSDSIILIGTSGTVGSGQGFKNGGTSSQTITVFNVDSTAKSTDMRNNGSTATSGNIKIEGTARVKPDQVCNTTGTTDLVAKNCDKGADKADITKGETKTFWQALKAPRLKSSNLVTTLTNRCTNGALTTTTSSVQTGTAKNGSPIYTTYTTRTMTLLPGIYGTTEMATLQSIFNSTSTANNVCGRDWVTGVTTQHVYFSPGSYTFRGTTVVTINNPKLVLNGRMPQTDGTWVACERPADKWTFDDVQLQNAPDGFEWNFEDSAAIVLQNGDIDMCPTSYNILPRQSLIADANYTGTGDVLRMVPATGATPTFTARGMVFSPAASIYLQAAAADSIALLGGIAAKALTIVPPPTVTNYTLTTGSQKTPGERYVTLTVKSTKNGTTKTISKTTVRVKDAYGQNTDSTGKSRPAGYELRKSNG